LPKRTALPTFLLLSVPSSSNFNTRGQLQRLSSSTNFLPVMLAAIEAVVGLFIEISFIATFTKRFFGS
jgi:hypothetical protein